MIKHMDRTEVILLLSIPILIGVGFYIPEWVQFLLQVSLASGLVAVGVMLQMRAGLVSFGQGLYFCVGAYAAGMAGYFLGVSDIFLLLIIGFVVSVIVGYFAGFLMRRYREIFFAMLSLALSMILYGLLVKAAVLGSTDGFNLPRVSYFGWTPTGREAGHAGFIATCIPTLIVAVFVNRYLRGPMGFIGEALRENELRLEYLGASSFKSVHIIYVVAAGISGIGGVLAAISVGHIDPEMTYWTTSGQFVFVALLSGTANVAAPLIGTFLLEMIRVYAVEFSPNTWQLILGSIMLATILFLPKGLWSLVTKYSKRPSL